MTYTFEWVEFYKSLAKKLYEYKDDRKKFETIAKNIWGKVTGSDKDFFKENAPNPFSVFGYFNREPGKIDRRAKLISDHFGLKAVIPQVGLKTLIPALDEKNGHYFLYTDMWELFIASMDYARNGVNSDGFVELLDKINIDNKVDSAEIYPNNLKKMSLGLYYIQPDTFIPLYPKIRLYLYDKYKITAPDDSNITGRHYLELLEELKARCLSIPLIVANANQYDIEMPEMFIEKYDKNIILYGAPGTGKTYSTVIHAVEIIEGVTIKDDNQEEIQEAIKRYKKYKADGQIEFVTFHQSYGYEDFIEGIRPVLKNEMDSKGSGTQIEYKIQNGVFKTFCDKARENKVVPVDTEKMYLWFGLNENFQIWKIIEEDVKGCESYEDVEKGDILIIDETPENRRVGIITKFNRNYRLEEELYIDLMYENGEMTSLSKQVEEKIDLCTTNLGKEAEKVKATELMERLLGQKENYAKNYVFIIDEINRGNISKIFGELITLIEPSRRIGGKDELILKLPYSGEEFGVPGNVYIIGTMNTADRSIAMIDTALRRRFKFIEKTPKPELLMGVEILDKEGNKTDIKVNEILETINNRIEVLLDRDHVIGHSFFLPLKEEKQPTIKKLAEIFEKDIIPLLQEYFYDDYEKIRAVLGDYDEKEKNNYINKDKEIVKDKNLEDFFGSKDEIPVKYKINKAALEEADFYKHFKKNQEDGKKANNT